MHSGSLILLNSEKNGVEIPIKDRNLNVPMKRFHWTEVVDWNWKIYLRQMFQRSINIRNQSQNTQSDGIPIQTKSDE